VVALNRRDAIFVDSSAWYALLDADDRGHAVASQRFYRATELQRPMVSTNHVVAETYTLVRRRLGNRPALTFLQRTRDDPLVQRVFVSEAWERDAEHLLEQYDDQAFSYVDATSFVTMRHLGIDQVLTFDSDFLIAGFSPARDD
jgi:uncharacterized protein